MLIGQEITVIGGGIGGMAAALACAQRGARVTVLERADALRELGAGVQISPNGMAVLDALGVGDAVRARSVAGRTVRLLDGRAGTDVLQLDIGALPGSWQFVHRADLLAALAEAAAETGVDVLTGQPVASVAADGDSAALHLWDGTVRTTPLAIGADGIRSVARAALGPVAPTRFTRQVAWRALIPATEDSPPEARVFMGPGRHLVAYPICDGRVMNVVAVQERKEWAAEGWTQPDDPESLRAAFADFAAPVRALLDDVDDVYLWGLFRHPVAQAWHAGRLVALGDAVHPTLPFLAQGACMALEDAWVLAASLARHDRPEDAFAAYQHARRARCVRIVGAANANARVYHLRDPLRSLAYGAMRFGGAMAPDAPLKRFDWLYRHDVTRAVP
jgi:salicylate hydroxylase